ncbi:MAG: nucleotidyltransferase family protein [Deltaproteobacteria bacterium]|nr:nucleotidyltransferase family protein [Deltaproteobacteria bacterium]
MQIIIAALIPAAGASRRMGRDKRSLPYRDRTVLEVTVDTLRQAGARPLVVVLEPDSPCAGFPGLSDAVLVENPQPQRGMLSSIRVGLAALPDEVDAVAVLPGDHPFVPPQAVQALFARFARERPALLVPRYPRQRGSAARGHPLLMARELFAEAAACDDAVGLRQLLRRHPERVQTLDLDLPDADDDLDTPEDLKKLER